MVKETGLRERKKAQTRRHIADTAARLFAEHGYDQVSIVDVARAAEVSDQTVYNYFPAKQDLAFDLAEEIRDLYAKTVLERPDGTSPAVALRPLALEHIERHRGADLGLARGALPALCVSSPTIRRLTLEAYDQHAEVIAAAITETCPDVHPAIARAHAAALVSVFQLLFERIGHSVVDGTSPAAVADELTPAVEAVFDDLDRHFRSFHAPAAEAT
ncbi:TetR/AcrR family transcriptional regulator [Amycolatopsis saalfeldensis]|uniref:DNA-binding transcriptional regulator, AcrR family n=1 Tax=Amycolatopsis saalfeldensis TaxID=394193 RepID=A0A1H8SQI9_9PSEU|nr:TetR/AcrR family transcriptional regulator [Amycolatopsis saalfeldensis]SEO80594.1 DNA-binding transcriptional regulator, AcrR family [Amycolatopsis saalfeldensis]